MVPIVHHRHIRATVWLLALVICFVPALQAIAGTLADTHCRHGQDPAPANAEIADGVTHHHAHDGADDPDDRAVPSSAVHVHAHCVCPCGVGCASTVALVPELPVLAMTEAESPPAISAQLRAATILSVPQRPPASSR